MHAVAGATRPRVLWEDAIIALSTREGWGKGQPAERHAALTPAFVDAMLRSALFLIAASLCLASAAHANDPQAATATTIDAARQAQLIRMVRQDCGSCHGIQLTGGLGPAITREQMADFPFDSLVAVIYNGRPGTAMPGWKTMISEADAHWIAHQLQAGFPLEAGRTAP